jgi:menaquinone-dependent protoporphyrinogen oxidase
MDNKILIAYASRTGATAEVSESIARVLREAGAQVDVRPLKEAKQLTGYQSVIIGSAARIGKLVPETVRFAQKHSADLQKVKTAYFTVCLTMKDDTPENRQTATTYLEPLRQIKEPVSIGLFAGALIYSKLSPVLRFFFSRDTSGQMVEGDYRNWEAIQTWAKELAPRLIESA